MIRISLLVFLAAIWSTTAIAANQEDARVALARAEAAVDSAASADAATAAATEMRAAQENLTSARGAMERRSWDASVLNAEKAVADANLAAARARQRRATRATGEIESSLQTLRQAISQPRN